MTDHLPRPRAQAGFTLLEVLVAFAVLSITLVTVMGVFSTGLRAAAIGHDYQEATVLAEAKLVELAATPDLAIGSTEDAFDDRYRWRATVAIPEWWDRARTPPHPLVPLELTVAVGWREQERDRSVVLTTLRLDAAAAR